MSFVHEHHMFWQVISQVLPDLAVGIEVPNPLESQFSSISNPFGFKFWRDIDIGFRFVYM